MRGFDVIPPRLSNYKAIEMSSEGFNTNTSSISMPQVKSKFIQSEG
jgi:hypothetical protein